MFNRIYTINIDELDDVWADIPTKYTAILAIALTGNKTLSAQDQFKTIYSKRTLVETDKTTAKNSFIMIFMDNLILIEQIGKTQELIAQLADMTNWADVTKYTSKIKNIGNVTTNTGNKAKTFNLTSDSNSQVDPGKIGAYIDLESKTVTPIPANNLAQTGSADSSLNIVDNTGDTITDSNTNFSNSARDFEGFLKLKLPRLREKFWSKFHPLFRPY